MPNHVHLLIQMQHGFQLRKQLTETMRYSGRKVNAQVKRRTLWVADRSEVAA